MVTPPYQLIFVLGGSTVQGRPFAPETAFPAWAEEYLNASDDVDRIRVVNCGGVSFASDRLSRLVPELLTYDPDLIVIATGHNEFLEDHTYSRSHASGVSNAISQLKTVALIRRWIKPDLLTTASAVVPVANHELKAKLDNTAGYETYHYDVRWHADVVRQFRTSILQIIDQCEAAKVPVCLVELAANSRDCAPLKSEHSPLVSEAALKAWRVSMDQAEGALESTAWSTAISFLQDCVRLSPEHALSHFRLARCYRANQQFQDASRHFQFALDHDVCPLRMKSDLVDSMRKIAQQRRVSLIDCDVLLGALRNDGRDELGFDVFLDHVHPTIRGHQVIGRTLAETIQALGRAEAAVMKKPSDLLSMFDRRIAEQPAAYFKNGRRRIGWLESWARAKKTSQEVIPVTVGDLTKRIRRQLELRDDTRVSQLASVLVKTRDGHSLLIGLAEDFLQGGQHEPAAFVVQQVVQAELAEDLSQRLNWIQDQLRSGVRNPSELESSPHLDELSDDLLSDSQRSLIRGILVQSEQ